MTNSYEKSSDARQRLNPDTVFSVGSDGNLSAIDRNFQVTTNPR
jgi:hypothetical protein